MPRAAVSGCLSRHDALCRAYRPHRVRWAEFCDVQLLTLGEPVRRFPNCFGGCVVAAGDRGLSFRYARRHGYRSRRRRWRAGHLAGVRGRVQGIGYREACVHRARALGVTGWVRNRMDESVEAMLQGAPRQLAQMCAWLDEGMPAALVEGLEVVEVPAPFPRFEGFERLPTA